MDPQIERALEALDKEMERGGIVSIRATTFFVEPGEEIDFAVLQRSAKTLRDLNDGKLKQGFPKRLPDQLDQKFGPEVLLEIADSVRRLNNGELHEMTRNL